MVLKKFKYFDSKKKTILVKKVSVFSSGLMFRKSSVPLLFDLKKEKNFSITAIFCNSFEAILLDKNNKVLKKITVKGGTRKIKCYGKYLLEIM